MQIDDAATILAGADFFEICTEDERRLLAFASERRRFAAGEVIVESGKIPDGAHILVSGSISIKPDGSGEANPHVVSQAGAVISTMALVVARPREVTIRAVGAVDTLFVPRNAFMKLANQSPQLARKAVIRIRRDLVGFVSAVTPVGKKIKKD
jgi:CRP-like cAMP-binding protein